MPKYKTAKPYEAIEKRDLDKWLSLDLDRDVRYLIICLWIYGMRISEAIKLRPNDFKEVGKGLQCTSITLKRGKRITRVLWADLKTPYIEALRSYVFSIDQMSKIFTRRRETYHCKLKKIDSTLCSHRFRHNRATRFALNGATPFEIQYVLGHVDIRQSVRYVHMSGIIAQDLGKRIAIS